MGGGRLVHVPRILLRRSTRMRAAASSAQEAPSIGAAGLRAGAGADVGAGVGACEQVLVQSCAVIDPRASSAHCPIDALQLYMGALQAATHSLAGCVLLRSISHWPVAALQLYPVHSASVTRTAWLGFRESLYSHAVVAPEGQGQSYVLW